MGSCEPDLAGVFLTGIGSKEQIFAGAHREEGTPGPIPNPVVKLLIADDTAYLYVGK